RGDPAGTHARRGARRAHGARAVLRAGEPPARAVGPPGADRGDRVRCAPGPEVRTRAVARPVGGVRPQGRPADARPRRRSLLDDGEALEAPEPGRVEFGGREGGGGPSDRVDLFDEEERPPKRLVLVVMVEQDAPDLIEALRAEGVGARLGERTD